ncbi:hypothetical protein P691DRAFT_800242 [Macrolepiota fuliginosa MF-IS2]|uniref:PQ-loop-domain-containing protein n=1 Tax=Macrolepiota fuliginosa MF-IS2 TaxID=1400762 RepID=A0A9P6C9Y9_9AGAR|nr:hypothetical protein P691DRAFT_800242 [Macrolepiota fuliginosa MF-IS2]
MKQNPVAENVLGTMGTICWTGQLIPQVWKNYRAKKTVGLSPFLMLLWGIATMFLGAYSILQRLNIPLQIQPQLFGFLSLVSWGQCLYYDPGRQDRKRSSIFITVSTMIFIGALELMLVFVSRPAYERGVSAPITLFGVLSIVTIAGGLLPQYWEIYIRKEVVGVSYVFISIDMLGGLLNALSLAFSTEFDPLAGTAFISVVIMDSVIIFAAIILNPRARRRRRLQAATTTAEIEAGAGAGVRMDDSVAQSPNTAPYDGATEKYDHEIAERGELPSLGVGLDINRPSSASIRSKGGDIGATGDAEGSGIEDVIGIHEDEAKLTAGAAVRPSQGDGNQSTVSSSTIVGDPNSERG